jgi:prepilin signal peptidase PulO-like enzyme (type II secretory pathway)
MARIPYGYALSEATLAVLFFMSALIIPVAHLPYFLAALFFLAIVVLYDLRHTIVPLPPTYLLIAASVLFAYVSAPDFHALISVFLTACCIALGFFLMHVLSKGRWMGLGDTPVAFALSLLAAPYAVAGLLFSFWIGAVIGIGILVATPKGHRMGIEVPFIPFLAAGYLLAFFTQWNPLPF